MSISSTRLYGASIAMVSGAYSLLNAATGMQAGPMMDPGWGGWIMAGLGVAVLIHGLVLLTPVAERIGRISGPLMVLWAVAMLADQWLIGMTSGTRMMPMMEPDGGMIAIAVLMLISGLIMIARPMGDRPRG